MAKNFKNQFDPAMQFISQSEPAPKAHQEIQPPPEGYKINPLYIEKRTKHVHSLIKPSLYESIKARAESEGISVNELIHSILEQAMS